MTKKKTYCWAFEERPQKIENMVLCAGAGFWPPCGQFGLCIKIKPKPPRDFVNRNRYPDD